MLGAFRRHLNSWVARLFFLLLVGTFVLWGVGDVIRNIGADDTSVATVAGRKIEMPEVQDAYRRQLQQVTRMFGGKLEPTPDMRRGIAAQAVEQLITQAALNAGVANMGLVVPDAALRQAIYDMPAFHDTNGKFDRTQFQSVLVNNNLTEARLLEVVRAEQGQKELMEAARAGVVSPDTLTKLIFAFQQEKRIADAVFVNFSAVPPPTPPTAEQLSRSYDNHKDLYSTPEYRHIKVVVLSPDTVSHDVTVSEDDLKGAYEQHRAEYNRPEKRTVHVLLSQTEDAAKALAQKWADGADWTAMQAEGAAPVELTDATKSEIPAPELAAAVFAAAEGVVPPPVHSALGWHVFKVTKITAGANRSLAEVHDELRAQVVADKAADVIYERASKIEDLLAGGTPLDELPGDLGLAAATGTVDSKGNTSEGQPAPIPGPAGISEAVVQAAFQMKKGEPPHLAEAPRTGTAGQAYFAVALDDITPPAPKPLEQVEGAVRADWTRDAVRHAAEEDAAKILAAVKGGQSLAGAAPGLTVTMLPPVGRATGAQGVPPQLVDPLFALKVGEPTMVETPDGFMVAVLQQVQDPDPNADAIGYGQVRDALQKALGDDVQAVLTIALRDRAKPKVNSAMIDSIAQPE